MANIVKLNGYDIKDKAVRDYLTQASAVTVETLFSTLARTYYYEGQEITFSQSLDDFDFLIISYDSYNYNPADDDDPTNSHQMCIANPNIASGTSFTINDTFMDSEYEYMNCNTMSLLMADNTFKKLQIVESIKGAIKMSDGSRVWKEWDAPNSNTYAYGICLREIKGVKIVPTNFAPIG